MKTDNEQEIIKRLDTIVFLLLELKDKEGKMAVKEKVKLLGDAGLSYMQIAKVLNRSPGSIAAQLSQMKKGIKEEASENPESSSEMESETNGSQ